MGIVTQAGTRSRNFSVSWSGGSGNGTNCSLETSRDSGFSVIENTLTGQTCDSGSISGQYWASGTVSGGDWNGGTLYVRLKNSGGDVISDTGSGSLTCSATGGSGSSTPAIDEDCDGEWDNTTFTGYNCGPWEWSRLCWAGLPIVKTIYNVANYAACDSAAEAERSLSFGCADYRPDLYLCMLYEGFDISYAPNSGYGARCTGQGAQYY